MSESHLAHGNVCGGLPTGAPLGVGGTSHDDRLHLEPVRAQPYFGAYRLAQ